ncbi:50S ribosomal protein L32 [Candidatus Nomurabacteria bacterium]|uniref:Large ribosomal subunit protein bL32 n=1 Tax=candidate division WWE3 bacterium TaxID=2053526 RepID=A0A955E083_UNCKA|nr:50S ribosomal protein L32 [candidate division WWE3 bacterium]MCB9823734.1 50S ribosomal protein L32 [Candidatus Nomurabacteria bacterium]MCB9827187.1 50S ribosomal protein L32 [Candidatus Nomurabacteria bacterium]MCB9827529.1 50S ribosomal protein L32 [Candidatus Nomurabacteria bacterium]HXK52792.1 50S ribosomal protein L32 [bacterium]
MPRPKRKHSKGRVRRKRDEKMQQQVVQTVQCEHCKAQKLPHRVCDSCGKE